MNSNIMGVVSGENGEVLFTQFECKADRPHCRHIIGDEEGISVKFYYPHIVNKISFLLPCNKEFNRLYTYQVRTVCLSLIAINLCSMFILKIFYLCK